jgi:hypothetical protein
VAPKQEQSLLAAHAEGTSTQKAGNGPASGGRAIPEHSLTHTCVGVQVALSHGVDGRTDVVHTFETQRSTTALAPLPGGAFDPSSVVTLSEKQPQPGYMASHAASSEANRLASVLAIPIASSDPQQFV